MEYLGTVKAIHRYPVKSMGGESLASADLRWPGIDGDRQYAFYRAANGSRFPWLTGREVSELVTYRARYLEPENPRRSVVQVSTPEQAYDVCDPALLERISQAAREEVRLLQVGRGAFDSMPVSVISTATATGLGERFGRVIDMRRFRTNILVETPNGRAARETEWVGGTLIFGEETTGPRLRANVAIDRCAMITIDPETGARDPALLGGVVEDFNNEIGVRCATEATGTIAVGDPVRIARS